MLAINEDLMTDDEDDIVVISSGPPCGRKQPAFQSAFKDDDFRKLFEKQPANASDGGGNLKTCCTDAKQSSATTDSKLTDNAVVRKKSKRPRGFVPLDDRIQDLNSIYYELLTDDEDSDEVQIIKEVKRPTKNEPEVIQLDDDDDDELGLSAAQPPKEKKPVSTVPTANRRYPRYSQTQLCSVEERLQNKRAHREKYLNGEGPSNGHSASNGASLATTSACRFTSPPPRLFGRAFSPTAYTPEKRIIPSIEEINLKTSSDIGEFLRVLFHLDLKALNFDYSEEMITEHLRKCQLIEEHFRVNEELPLTYESLNQYKLFYLPLIIYDTWAQIVSDSYSRPHRQLTLFKRISDTKADQEFLTICLRGLVPSSHIYSEAYSIEYWIVIVQEPAGEGEFLSPSYSSRVLQMTHNKKIALGFVQVYNNKLKMHSNEHSAPQTLPILGRDDECSSLSEVEYVVKIPKTANNVKLVSEHQQLSLQPVYYFRPSIRLVETLSLMNFKQGFEQTFLKPEREVSSLDYNQPDGFRLYEAETFNDKQRNAIVACFNAVQQPYSKNKTVMIQGPPGTGKTHTLVGIVKNLFINCSQSKLKPLRILICAPSNGAIDEIALRLIRDRDFLREFTEHKLRIVRIGQRTQVHPRVKPFLLENLVEQNYQFCQRSRPRTELRDEQLLSAHVILSTLASVQLSCMNIFRQEFMTSKRAIRCVIVDEASQSTEPELLMPFIYPISKMILIGDHLQLPATVVSRTALRMGYGRSMFERLYRHFEKMDPRQNPMLTLCRQFRMNHAICVFPSRHFYKGLLETPSGIGKNAKIPIQPYFIFDVADANEKRTSNLINASKYNVNEADFIFRLILIVFEKLGYKLADDATAVSLPEQLHATIGVITFYSGQKQELIKRLEEFRGGILVKHIDVNTVDAFQGQERDIVILSCVRALESTGDIASNSVGFVRSQQRMNVALTRAKSVLFICLHAKSFCNVPRWQQLLSDAQSRNRYVRMGFMVTDQALMKKISL